MLDQFFFKTVAALIGIPAAQYLGSLVSEVSPSAGTLVEKMGTVGALIAFIYYLIKRAESDRKQAAIREESLAETLQEQREQHSQSFRELTEAINNLRGAMEKSDQEKYLDRYSKHPKEGG